MGRGGRSESGRQRQRAAEPSRDQRATLRRQASTDEPHGLANRGPPLPQPTLETKDQPSRGRDAGRLREIPLQGWRDVLARVAHEVGRDQLDIVAAGVAFYALLALFPALIALVSFYGLVASPETVATQIDQFSDVLPPDVAALVNQQLTEIISAAPSSLTFGAFFSLAVSFWTASSGVVALMDGVNIAYDETETRGYLERRKLAAVLTLGALIVTLLLIAGIVGVPVWIEQLGFGGLGSLVTIGRWPLLVLIYLGSACVVYRYGPDRTMARWRWVWFGAAVAAVLWLTASLLFSLYVSWFGRFNTTYGTLGAVVVLLLWLYISAFILLLGAELNAELERQTRADTTIRSERPMGDRGAYVADTVGPTADEVKASSRLARARKPGRPPTG